MLEVLLSKLRGGGFFSLEQLADEMSVSAYLVKMMIDELDRRGLLQEALSCTANSCDKCMHVSACLLGRGRCLLLKGDQDKSQLRQNR